MVAIVLILIIFCLLFIFRKNTAFLNLAVLSSMAIDQYWNNDITEFVISLLGSILNKILINEKLTIDVTIHLLYRLKNPTTLVE